MEIADLERVGIDKRLVEYWRRQQAARRPKAAAPGPSPAGGRPVLHEVTRADGSHPAERPSNVVPLEPEDR